MTDRLILIRHGVTDWNREGRFQGHLDPPLSTAGAHEARLAARRLAADPVIRPGRIVSSSLERAFQTASIIAEAITLEVTRDPRLIEIGQGEWEGRTATELEAVDADRYRAWREASGIRQPPGGESIESAATRVSEVLAEVTAGSDWPVCLVSHGGTLRILATLLLELSGPGHPGAMDVDNASISVLARAGAGWRLDRWNDTRHLLGIELTHVDESDGRPLAL